MKRDAQSKVRQDRATLVGLLLRFRTNEPVVGAALIIDDVQAKKLLAAFSLSPLPPWHCPRGDSPVDDDRELWEWLWRGFAGGPDSPHFLADVAAAAGLSIQTAQSKWAMLRTSRLVYPDGTLSEMAQQVLGAFVASNLPKQPRPQPTPPPQTRKDPSDGK